MEQKGLFRSALSGFHKQDVLNYIDQITAEWNGERQQLQQQADADREQAQQACETVQQITVEKEQAEEAARQAQAENETLTARLAALEEELAQLRGLPGRVAALTEEVQELTTQRDAAVAENQQLSENLAAETERARTATSEMMAAEERLNSRTTELTAREEALATAQEQLRQYEALLGQAGAAGRHVDGIVRPYMDEVNHRADEVLDEVQTALCSLLSSMGELQSRVEETRHSLRTQQADSASRLSAALEDWQHKADEAAVQTTANPHFFR